MDIINLRVFNSIYELGITEQDFKEIEEEQKHKERTGLYIHKIIKCKPKKFLLCVSHDQDHKIIIHQFMKQAKPKTRVILKTLIFLDPPKEIYTLHKISQYRALDTQIKYVANTLNELKSRVLDRFIDKYPKELGQAYEDVYDTTDSYNRRKNKTKRPKLITEQIEALYWLFGEKYDGKDFPSRINVPRIVKVWQKDNKRLALIQIKENWEAKRGFMYKEEIDRTLFEIKTFTPSDWRYNYVCPNREFCYVKDDGEVWVDDELFEKVLSDELFAMCQNNTLFLLDGERYNDIKSEIRIRLNTRRRAKEMEEAKKILIDNIEKQFNNGKVIRHGITFSKESISYEGLKIRGDRIRDYFVRNNILYLETPNFYKIFEGYINHLLEISVDYNYYPYNKTSPKVENVEKLSVGKIEIILEPLQRKAFLVNKFKIHKDDIEEVIKQSIRYDNQKDYDEYVEYSSKVCLKLQKVLKEGVIKFELEIDRTEDNALSFDFDSLKVKERRKMHYNNGSNNKMILALPVLREKEKNYILIKKNKYRIKNVKSLLNLNDGNLYRYEGYLQKTIKQLYMAISKITPQDIADIISKGIKEYQKFVKKQKKILNEKIKKSEEFLAHAIRLTRAIKVDGGYIVRGLSGMNYFIEESEDVRCYTTKGKKKDKYLCLVDISKRSEEAEEQAGVNDKIARRMLMLSKDRKVAKEIYERGDHQDKWWLEISDKKIEVEI